MNDPQNSEPSDESTIVGDAEMLPDQTAETFQQVSSIEHSLPMPLTCSEKVELWLRAGFSGATRPLTEGRSLQQGWIAPYIEHDLSARPLRSSEKVELWLRAHFSHTVSERLHNEEGNSIQPGERSSAAESVITSLAALEILP